ncbi:MAG: hypothetical protein ACRCR9_04455 [Chitinophagaceae bacterium]
MGDDYGFLPTYSVDTPNPGNSYLINGQYFPYINAYDANLK